MHIAPDLVTPALEKFDCTSKVSYFHRIIIATMKINIAAIIQPKQQRVLERFEQVTRIQKVNLVVMKDYNVHSEFLLI